MSRTSPRTVVKHQHEAAQGTCPALLQLLCLRPTLTAASVRARGIHCIEAKLFLLL